MDEHPGVVFKDGPSGRRAALQQGPDIWEVVTALREMDERDDDAVDATVELLNLSPARVSIALRYYGAYSSEIDQELADAETASARAEEEWKTAQRLLH